MARVWSEFAHRMKIYGMGKEELVGKVKDFARSKLGINITKKFLKQFPPPVLYGAMLAAQGGKMHKIFHKWQSHQREMSVQEQLPF